MGKKSKCIVQPRDRIYNQIRFSYFQLSIRDIYVRNMCIYICEYTYVSMSPLICLYIWGAVKVRYTLNTQSKF